MVARQNKGRVRPRSLPRMGCQDQEPREPAILPEDGADRSEVQQGHHQNIEPNLCGSVLAAVVVVIDGCGWWWCFVVW